MRINIQYLEKHEIFATLYNHAARTNDSQEITLEQAQLLIQKRNGDLKFQRFDAHHFLSPRKHPRSQSILLNIDLSSDIALVCDDFDARYNAGTCEALINGLRMEKIDRLQQQLVSFDRSESGELLGPLHVWDNPPLLKEPAPVSDFLMQRKTIMRGIAERRASATTWTCSDLTSHSSKSSTRGSAHSKNESDSDFDDQLDDVINSFSATP